LELDLTPDQAAVVASVRRFAEKELAPNAAAWDREETFPAEAIRRAAKLGLCGMLVPRAYGGSDVGPVAYALAIQEVAKGCGSTAVTLSVTNMVAETILKWGTAEQRARFLPQLFSGEFPTGAFALTEPHAGSDASALTTRADRADGGYVLGGGKIFITSGDVASLLVVYARTDKAQKSRGISAFVVERGTPGLVFGTHEDKMGLKASRTIQVGFEDCFVPEANRLGAEGQGFTVALSALDGGRIGIASQALGIGRAALAAALRYAQEREQFGQPIARLGAVAAMLADMATELDAAELLVLRAASMKADGRPFAREAAMAKLFATEAANRACGKAVQVLGGYGCTVDYPVERHFRDCKVTTLYEGTSEIQRLVIARHVLG
jgi:alkylation response protein AidB-like acyl-CoA dehydrogenase